MSADSPRVPKADGEATLSRSIRLFAAFRKEQSDPAYFYSTLASDTVTQMEQYQQIRGSLVVDVGAGPGYFRRAFEAAGASYISIDADAGEMAAASLAQDTSLLGDAQALPLRTGSVDVVFSSNVLEHVPRPEVMADEMLRVARPGGLVFLSYTLWLSPWGGHETSPWHYVGGEFAARRYEQRHGVSPKNRYGSSLFEVSASRMLAWAAAQERADILAAKPRYHPRWAQWVVRVPGVRELATWNLLLVLRRR